MEEKVSSRESSSGSESSSGPSSPASPGSEAAKAGSCSSSAAGGGGGNAFANDGSFMELFKKKMEEERRRKELEEAGNGQATEDKKPVSVASFVGKRRGGAKLALKTGVVAKKQKPDSEAETGKGDAWSKYMAEVKKYKAHQCGDDDKTRPLVK
ncbi:telomerase RNA component interacting RNase-like [Neoarius graeffei]|uniref:telomerase RNA component interacting RNase-like n=1 Tax=Neoarius graeffei TaxID=443677 RepID=UPI00298C0120|nr:telomerase RNA component interacting RNase-like [Neoarius graeffei]